MKSPQELARPTLSLLLALPFLSASTAGQSAPQQASEVLEALKIPSESRSVCRLMRNPALEDLDEARELAKLAAKDRRGELGALAYEAVDRLEPAWGDDPGTRETMQALEELDIERTVELIRFQREQPWFADMIEQARAGEGQAQYDLGLLFSDPNFDCFYTCDHCALAWLTKAGEAGHVPAMLEVGRRLHEGIDIQPREEKAVMWFKRASSALAELASEGDLAAMGKLGQLALYGYGSYRGATGIKDEQIVGWLQVGSEQGDPRATACLAYAYEHGLGGLEASTEKARELYEQAMDMGSGAACVWRLEMLNRTGEGESDAAGLVESRLYGLGEFDEVALAWAASAAFDQIFQTTVGQGPRVIPPTEPEGFYQALVAYRRARQQGARPDLLLRLHLMNDFHNYIAAYPDLDAATDGTLWLAEFGNADSCGHLARSYESGLGRLPIDDYRAAEWRARNGEKQSLLRLAQFAEAGRGGLPMDPDLAEALRERAE